MFDEFALSDRIRVVVGSATRSLSGDEVAERIAARIRVKPEVVIASAAAVQRQIMRPEKRKPVTFFDHRQNRRQACRQAT